MSAQSPPVMSIAFLHPVLDAMRAQGCSEEVLTGQLSIASERLDDPATMLPADRIYGFLEWATGQMGDPFLCARIGQRMARGGWAPINPLLTSCRTVWDFFRQFSVIAEEQGGAASYRLVIEGRIALWKLNRSKGVSESARFADAMATAFFVELLRQSRGADMTELDCIAMTPDADLVPNDILLRTNVIAGASGMTLRFPSDWLDRELGEITPLPDVPDVGLPDIGVLDLGERVRRLLDQHLSDPEFGLEKVSAAIGVPAWKLQKTLRNAGTSVAGIRNDLRHVRAQELLTSGELEISEIAVRLGYTNPSNFSRAFKARAGVSPVAFRKDSPPDGRGLTTPE
ncbi:helix-turn-helix domain-containing protein [Lutimaribacter marinistellae]|uniref:Helix-turn-helix domain-containing protein n=1 Tax=Lutimaribacter marinistellae TaxID=1820329 RepID=A0ABV7TCU3_9RHOB